MEPWDRCTVECINDDWAVGGAPASRRMLMGPAIPKLPSADHRGERDYDRGCADGVPGLALLRSALGTEICCRQSKVSKLHDGKTWFEKPADWGVVGRKN
ncbi:hypothetical protein CCUS01_09837 [Colletotrichum cuscutae]|uniref:Uncharacterized protein n=1 Tax=Colletotrichum cuscutae TaxID=1209917 RepID=A0AAI9UH73_9PEZI|nr:hypothetical protein CCUS01_09837 [Colletotrichum cuscutae]